METNISTSVAEKTFAILESTKTNWNVDKLPLVTQCGKTTESYGLFRSDNSQWLATFKDSYQPMQNAALVELLVQATELLGLEVTNGGTLRSGARVFYQMELPQMYIGKSNVKRNITALNSHDGSSCIGFGSTNTVVICNNTFNRAHREMEKVKHTLNSYDRVREIAEQLRNSLTADQLMFDNFKRMADVEMKDEMVERVIRKLFNADAKGKVDDISTRKQNQIVAFADSLNKEIQLEGKTIWGLFNAVTRYTNHVAAPKGEENKLDYLMFGTGARLNNLAFNELMFYVEQNTAEYVMVG